MSDADDMLADIERETLNLVVSAGLSRDDAGRLAASLVARIRAVWAGERVYVGERDRARRDAAVLDDLRVGMARPEICQRHDISERTLLRIIARSRPQPSGLGREEWVL